MPRLPNVNARKILRGEAVKANYRGLKTVSEIGEFARARWIVPRAERRPDYKSWKREQFRSLLLATRARDGAQPSQSAAFQTGGATKAIA